MKKAMPLRWVMALCMLSFAPFTQLFAATGPTVRVMPDGKKTPTIHTAYAWAGNPLVVWGNVTWGDSTSGTAVGDFGDGSPLVSGPVTNPRDISATHVYATAGTYYTKLTVTDGNGLSGSAQVRIDVLPVPDNQARINLAIERGLKYLYLTQYLPDQVTGYWYDGTYLASSAAATAMSVLAFENAGHLPISPASDIYQDTVVRGLNYLFTTLEYRTDFPNWMNPDGNGNGIILGQPQEEFYPHGMTMMAIVAAGPYNKNYPKTDAVHNPALNLTVPGSVPNISGWRYYDVLQDMMEYAVWAQADPGTWGRGGWRYGPNSGEADNSVGQWPAIGLEAAENWGIVAPAWVKTELKDYWLVRSYSNGGWGYTDSSYQTVSHSGAGLCLMGYAGIPQSDPKMTNSTNTLAANWAGNTTYTFDGYSWYPWPSHYNHGDTWYDNYYAMYGVAKGCRIARDAAGNIQKIILIGSINWYDVYSTYIISVQQADGGWLNSTYYWGRAVNTPWALLILEPGLVEPPPVAAITASPNPVNAGTNVNFDISGSTHMDPDRFLVSWKLRFDTTNTNKTWANPDVSGAFPVAGPIPKIGGYPQKSPPVDYGVTAIVQVTDDLGATDEEIVTVNIRTNGCVPPVADAGGPYFGSVNVPLTLDGSGSYDPNPGGSIVKYEWDLDGNGTYETDAGANPTLQHTWTMPYSGQVGLKVTDACGLTNTASVYARITVCDLKPVSYPLISYRRTSATVWEYTYKFAIKNVGTGDASAVSTMLQDWPAQVTVVDGNVSFPTVPGGGTPVTSSDTFTIRINRSVPVQNRDLVWRLQFTDSVGTTWTLVNFPLY